MAKELSVPKHVLRFWEGKFSHLKPMKRGGGRRYYRPEDVDLLKGIRQLLYDNGYTIKGVQRIFREQGPRYVMECGMAGDGDRPAAPVKDIPDLASETARRAAQSAVTITRRGPGDADRATVRLSPEQIELLTAALAEVEACRKILREAGK